MNLSDKSPLDKLEAMAMETVEVAPGLDHLEIYTMSGLLSVLWHGDSTLEDVVICFGGAMGGMLGPDGGGYQRLGERLLEQDIGTLRVSYRRPNDLSMCVHDALAVMELAGRHGAKRFITVGHSFGGAVAIQAAAHLDADSVPGVVTLATQSAGCEAADSLGDRDLLFIHGTADTILPHQASEMVRFLAETGEVWLIPGADHLLRPAGSQIVDRLAEHIPRVFAQAANNRSS